MNFIKLHWKLILFGIGALVVLIWIGSVTGMNSKLYDMALNNLRQDQGKIVKTLEGIVTEREKELASVYEQLDRVKQQQAMASAESERLRGKIRDLQNQRENIIVPVDADSLVIDFRQRGIGSAHRIKR